MPPIAQALGTIANFTVTFAHASVQNGFGSIIIRVVPACQRAGTTCRQYHTHYKNQKASLAANTQKSGALLCIDTRLGANV